MQMNDIRYGNRIFIAIIAIIAMLLRTMPAGAADWSAARDFLIQDVCTDPAGHALAGVSPLDGQAACPHARKLAIGENLPYHKRDWPGRADQARHPGGYQQSDSIPIATTIGPAVVHTYDFGDEGRSFGRFDPGDGGQIVFFAATAAIGVTEDGGAGLQLFLGPGCAPTDSWVIVDRTFATAPAGETLARITRRADLCPARLGYAYTRWQVVPVRFRPGSLTTLVSEHFGGRDIVTADHLERMYFTRELGYTRWERWQNPAVHDRARDRAEAASLAASGRCDPAIGAPASGWIMTDCREWTQVVPATGAEGDPPDFWVDRLQADSTTAAWFRKYNLLFPLQ